MPQTIAFQGEPGAYSHQACRETYPGASVLPCRSFEEAIEAVRSGAAGLAMLPVENSTFGRVADIHHLLPGSGLHIIGEAFVRVRIALLAVPGTPLDGIRQAMSHPMLLGQCRGFLEAHGIRRITGADTAGSARQVSEAAVAETAALASALAGEIYGLEMLADGIEDEGDNTTRFLVMAPAPDHSRRGAAGMMTSLLFTVRNIPAALYKAMGGFATNSVNMTKLESYMVGGTFSATQFHADIEGHPEDPNVALALEELAYFTSEMNILGVYPRDSRRD
ncbi:MAG: prephenate dehydratase [Rhodobacterales bacterium]|nr:prephenate dehydratase [Rhodobacterales bacterium]